MRTRVIDFPRIARVSEHSRARVARCLLVRRAFERDVDIAT